VGEARSSAHGASPDGDEMELESVKALYWVNTKGHKERKTGAYEGLAQARRSKDPVMQQSKPMPLADDKALYAHLLGLIAVV
jgi:hypothetical protein